MSNELIKIISDVCFGCGGLFAVAAIVLSILSKKTKSIAQPIGASVEYEITYTHSDTIIE
jgi:hypothetical protein